MEEKELAVDLELDGNYRFKVDFHQENLPPMWMDEPAPVGEGLGPNASSLLAAAVGNCLSASALFCLRKAKVRVQGLRTFVRMTYRRNKNNRLRIDKVRVNLELQVDPQDQGKTRRCMEIFEDYCVVTQSVREGLDVKVELTHPSA